MVLEALAVANELERSGFSDNQRVHARLEALRLAWKDHLDDCGDPDFVKVPVSKFLSKDYWREQAKRVKKAAADKKPIETRLKRHTDDGTNNLCVVDKEGNMVAVTLTHGGSFGAQVTVDGLGLTLGHGMSRFDPHPEHPNAPGPRKRPVHNMCPSLVLRDGRAVIAIGCAGGVRIPNCIYDVLTRYVFENASMETAVAAPRIHTTGTIDVALEPKWPTGSGDYLKALGFKVGRWETSAVLSAASFDTKSQECRGIVRGPAILDIHEQPAT
jgi:gamma-glutamyltranspeptidase/glutathione hydrolase